MLLVHLDETVADDGRLNVNELYTALKWYALSFSTAYSVPACNTLLTMDVFSSLGIPALGKWSWFLLN